MVCYNQYSSRKNIIHFISGIYLTMTYLIRPNWPAQTVREVVLEENLDKDVRMNLMQLLDGSCAARPSFKAQYISRDYSVRYYKKFSRRWVKQHDYLS